MSFLRGLKVPFMVDESDKGRVVRRRSRLCCYVHPRPIPCRGVCGYPDRECVGSEGHSDVTLGLEREE